MDETGNWRETSILNGHNPYYLIAEDDRNITINERHGDLAVLAVMTVIACTITVVVAFASCPKM